MGVGVWDTTAGAFRRRCKVSPQQMNGLPFRYRNRLDRPPIPILDFQLFRHIRCWVSKKKLPTVVSKFVVVYSPLQIRRHILPLSPRSIARTHDGKSRPRGWRRINIFRTGVMGTARTTGVGCSPPATGSTTATSGFQHIHPIHRRRMLVRPKPILNRHLILHRQRHRYATPHSRPETIPHWPLARCCHTIRTHIQKTCGDLPPAFRGLLITVDDHIITTIKLLLVIRPHNIMMLSPLPTSALDAFDPSTVSGFP